jgi:hypothetical protein
MLLQDQPASKVTIDIMEALPQLLAHTPGVMSLRTSIAKPGRGFTTIMIADLPSAEPSQVRHRFYPA